MDRIPRNKVYGWGEVTDFWDQRFDAETVAEDRTTESPCAGFGCGSIGWCPFQRWCAKLSCVFRSVSLERLRVDPPPCCIDDRPQKPMSQHGAYHRDAQPGHISSALYAGCIDLGDPHRRDRIGMRHNSPSVQSGNTCQDRLRVVSIRAPDQSMELHQGCARFQA